MENTTTPDDGEKTIGNDKRLSEYSDGDVLSQITNANKGKRSMMEKFGIVVLSLAIFAGTGLFRSIGMHAFRYERLEPEERYTWYTWQLALSYHSTPSKSSQKRRKWENPLPASAACHPGFLTDSESAALCPQVPHGDSRKEF